jgi:mono/diheme cytochrome c family protein
MKKISLIVLALVSTAVFFACRHQTYVTPTTNTNTNPTDPMDTEVCFQRNILPIFVNKCAMTGCHDAITRADGYGLYDYANIISKGIVKNNANGSKVYTECVRGNMPQSPYAALTTFQLLLLRKWIDEGAVNDTTCATACDTTKYTYNATIGTLLSTNCTGCHNATSAYSTGGGINLDNYTEAKTYALNGRLLGSVQRSTGYSAMPKGMAQLEDCKIIQIRKWVAAGAPFN